MPKNNDKQAENKNINDDIRKKKPEAEENEFSLFGSDKQTKLDSMKNILQKAGYGNELNSYGDRWFEAACKFGLIRDGNGNAFEMKKDETQEAAADRLSAENNSFYVANKDTSTFSKYADNGKGSIEERPYSTAQKIDRPNIVLRFLDYCGFNIPAVKEYKQQMQSVKDNPYFFRLTAQKAHELSSDFTARAADNEKQKENAVKKEAAQKEKEKKAAEKKAAKQKAKEKKAAEKKAKAEAKAKAKAKKAEAKKPAEKKPVEEKKPAEKKPEEKKPVEKKPDVKQPQEVKQAEPVAQKGQVEPKAVSVKETDTEITITMNDGSVHVYQKQLNAKNEKKKEQEEEKKEKSLSQSDKDKLEIDKKLAELSKKEKNYPASSPMGLAINNAKENLTVLKLRGMPEKPDSDKFSDQFEAAQKSASSLLLIDRMERMIKNLPAEDTQKLILGRENSMKIKQDLEKLSSSDAIKKAMGDAPAQKMRDILNDDKSFNSFNEEVTQEMKLHPQGNTVPKDAIIHGSVFKIPGTSGWQRMPGAKEEEVKSSLDELFKLPGKSEVFGKIRNAEKKFEDDRNIGKTMLQNRIEELDVLSEKYPEGSVMRALNDKALKSLRELNKTGMPENSANPNFAVQQKALKNAVSCMCACENGEKLKSMYGFDKVTKADLPKTIDKLIDSYSKNPLVNSMVKGNSKEMCRLIEGQKGKNGTLLGELRAERDIRKDNGIPEAAERKGVLFRMHPKEPWKQMPGASLKEVNDSMMTVLDDKITDPSISKQEIADSIKNSVKAMPPAVNAPAINPPIPN